jgi:ATP-dependent DNA helicase RecQ
MSGSLSPFDPLEERPLDLRAALSHYFGYDEFRPYQEPIIRKVMDGKSVLGILPTGAGKSLCYQLPALLSLGPTLVLSPLIALMKDQLDGLPPEVHPKATLINSSLDPEEQERRLAAIHAGEYKLIFAAPERLRQQGFLRLLQSVRLSLVVVDEAHCVSVWGHDFRPDYLFIRKALSLLASQSDPPTLLALTATATPEMQTEISEQLGRDLETISASPFRPNLRMEVFRCANADDKMRRLAEICRETPGASIIYANSRDRCEKLAHFLRGQGLPAAHYHAGLSREERQSTQERFMLGRIPLIVATVAFGMGVDKSNVRLVAHFSLPHSLEAYVQEAGRAGRDGRASRCVLLYAPSDKANLSRWLKQEEIGLETVRDVYRALRSRITAGTGLVSPEDLAFQVFGSTEEYGADTTLRVAISLLERVGLAIRHPDAGRDMRIELPPPPRSSRAELETQLEARRRHAETRLAKVMAYAEGPGCRHVVLSRHFGKDLEPCGHSCDRCLGTAEETVAVRSAPPSADQVPDLGRAILETILSLPFPMGRTGVAKVLSGAADSAVGKDRCENYGLLSGCARKSLMESMDGLIEAGLLAVEPNDEYRRISVTRMGLEALEEGREILPNSYRTAPTRASSGRASDRASSPEVDLTDEEEDRFERLRAWRRIEADRAQVPPYVVFHDATLRALARAMPRTPSQMETVPGAGPTKIAKFGAAVIAVLRGEEPSLSCPASLPPEDAEPSTFDPYDKRRETTDTSARRRT